MDNVEIKLNDFSIEQCRKELFADEHIKHFFEVSIPYAKTKGSALGHVLFICSDDETKSNFIKLLENTPDIEAVRSTNLLSNMAPPELAAILTSLQPGEMLVSNSEKLSLEDASLRLMKDAMSEKFMDILIGKGSGARTCRLELPAFTFVSCVSQPSKTTAELLPFFDYIIKIDDVNLPKICVAAIKEHCTLSISDELCDLIAYRSHYNVQSSIKCLNRVMEYATYKNQHEITKELIEDAIELSGMGIVIEDYTDDEDETLRLFREMSESLRELKDDVSFIRNQMEDFLAANGVL